MYFAELTERPNEYHAVIIDSGSLGLHTKEGGYDVFYNPLYPLIMASKINQSSTYCVDNETGLIGINATFLGAKVIPYGKLEDTLNTFLR